MKNKERSTALQDQGGQLVVEAVLLIVLGMFFTSFILKGLREHEFVKSMVPWAMLSGMVECGTWNRCAKGQHPNASDRRLSLNTEEL